MEFVWHMESESGKAIKVSYFGEYSLKITSLSPFDRLGAFGERYLGELFDWNAVSGESGEWISSAMEKPKRLVALKFPTSREAKEYLELRATRLERLAA
jgi:hypothetical protein|tara:strand:+ start:2658 stop:2954 length:297 start_codon:yes stop_codon:yes gene_type:complete